MAAETVMRVAAIVPAAGAGRRLGSRGAKAFVPIRGEPLAVHALKILEAHPAVRWIIPVVRESDRDALRRLLRRHRLDKALDPVLGGPSRADSVARGFAAVPERANWILVHDAARPCLRLRLLEAVLKVARREGAAACGLPASVTVKAADDTGSVRLTLDRDQLWLAQTPQVFRRDWFAQALTRADHELSGFPDDASLVEAAGFPVRMVPGDPWNLKVTTREDLVLAEAILAHMDQEAARRPLWPGRADF